MNKEILCLDIGGSSVKAGIFTAEHFSDKSELVQVLPKVDIEGRAFSSVQAAVFDAVRSGLESSSARSIGISTTGSVAPDGIVISAGHFEGYRDINWSEILREEFEDLEAIAVENDGKASAWAEYSHFGGPTDSHVHFVLGTGVGSSVVVNGDLVHGDSGEAGFLGHTRVTDGPTLTCSCDLEGCIETIASGPGLADQYSRATGNQLKDFDEFQKLLSDRDAAAVTTLNAACDAFGDICGVVVNALNPKTITFGGGVVLGIRESVQPWGGDRYFLERIQTRIAKISFYRSADSTLLEYGMFDNDGGLIGAALLAS